MFNFLRSGFLDKLIHHHEPEPLLSDSDILALANRLQLDHQHDDQMITRHLYAGAQQSSHRGSGMDFVENRQYLPGDNPTHINWRLSARLGKLHTRVYHEEKQSQTLVIVDRRPGMWFGTQCQLKVTQALNAAVLTMFSATRRHHAFATLILEQNNIFGDFHLGERYALQQAQLLARVDNRVDRETPCVSLAKTLSSALSAYPAGNKIVLISDFSDFDQHATAPLTALCQQNDVTAIYVTDPAEFDLPTAGSIDTVSSAEEEPVAIDTSDPMLREQYLELGIKRKHKILQDLSYCGADCYQLGTEQDAWDILRSALQ